MSSQRCSLTTGQLFVFNRAGMGLVGEFTGGILRSLRSARSTLTDHFLSEYGFSLLTILAAQFTPKASLASTSNVASRDM